MNAEAIREMLGRRPFERFEVIMSSGERHLVNHPEFLMVSPTRAVILDPVTDPDKLIVPAARRAEPGPARSASIFPPMS